MVSLGLICRSLGIFHVPLAIIWCSGLKWLLFHEEWRQNIWPNFFLFINLFNIGRWWAHFCRINENFGHNVSLFLQAQFATVERHVSPYRWQRVNPRWKFGKIWGYQGNILTQFLVHQSQWKLFTALRWKNEVVLYFFNLWWGTFKFWKYSANSWGQFLAVRKKFHIFWVRVSNEAELLSVWPALLNNLLIAENILETLFFLGGFLLCFAFAVKSFGLKMANMFLFRGSIWPVIGNSLIVPWAVLQRYFYECWA